MFYQHTYQLNQQAIKQEALYGICCLIQNPTEQVIQLRQWLAEQRFVQQQPIQQQIRQTDSLYFVNLVLNGRKITKQELNIASNSNQTINILYEIYSTGRILDKQYNRDEIGQLYNMTLSIISSQLQIHQLLNHLKEQKTEQQQLLNFFVIYLFLLQERANGSQNALNYAVYLQQILIQQLQQNSKQTIQLIRLLYLSLYLPQENQLPVISQILNNEALSQSSEVFQQVMIWFDQVTQNSQKDQLFQRYISQAVKQSIKSNDQRLIQLIFQYSSGVNFENQLTDIIQMKIQNIFQDQEQPDLIDIDIPESTNNKEMILYNDLLEIKREIKEQNQVDIKLLLDTIDQCPYLNVISSLICLILKTGTKIVEVNIQDESEDQLTFNKTNVSVMNLDSQVKEVKTNEISLKLLKNLCLSDLHFQSENFEKQKQVRKLAEMQLIQNFSNE